MASIQCLKKKFDKKRVRLGEGSETMKGDKECEEHRCEGLSYCTWHPNECYGKPWKGVKD